MPVERWLHVIAGTIMLASAALGYFHSPYWLLVTAFVGHNLLQPGLTNWCPMMNMQQALGARDAGAAKNAQQPS